MRRALTVLLAVLLAGAGCSGDTEEQSLTLDERTAARALAGQLLDSGTLSGRRAVARRQATCCG